MPSNTTEASERTFTMIGAGSAVMNLVAFTAVGAFAVENVAYGGVSGIFGAIGSYFFIPWFLSLSAVQEQSDEELSLTNAAQQVSQSTQVGLFGLGLELGAIVMLGVGLSLGPDFLSGIASALIVALAIYFVGSVLLDR